MKEKLKTSTAAIAIEEKYLAAAASLKSFGKLSVLYTEIIHNPFAFILDPFSVPCFCVHNRMS